MERSMKKYSVVFIVPTIAAFLLAFVIPFGTGLYLSLCDFRTVTNTTFVGLDNYIKAFTSQEFLNALLFTVKFAFVAVITVNVFAFCFALMLTRGIDRKSVV